MNYCYILKEDCVQWNVIYIYNLFIIYNESLEVEIVGLRRMNVETECTVGKSLNLAHENLMKIQN
jgi:hypothetical protein